MTARHVTVPTELAALAAGVSTATIRKWASRGKLTRYGTAGRAKYDLAELGLLADDSTMNFAQENNEGLT